MPEVQKPVLEHATQDKKASQVSVLAAEVLEVNGVARDVTRIPFELHIKAEHLQNPDTLEQAWVALPNATKARFVRVTGWEPT